MKSSILHLLSLFLLIAFTSSCGKKDSGSASQQAPVVNNVATNLSTTGAAALANLLAWYDSGTEGAIPSLTNGLFARKVTTQITEIDDNTGCDNPVKFLGMSFCAKLNISGSENFEEMITLIPSGDKKVSNDRLAAALEPALVAGADGLTLKDVTQQDTVFTITYVNAQNQSVIHVIDTRYNSRVNPVKTMDQEEGQASTIINIGY